MGITDSPIQPFISWNMDTSPGWTPSGQWAYGTPTGGGGANYGYPDPASGHTGTRVYGVNLSGDYSTTAGGPYYLTTAAINCSGHTQTRLNFWRWLNTDEPAYVPSTVDISINRTQWTNIYTNTGMVTDNQWSLMSYDISSIADNRSTVYIRWGYRVLSGAFPLSGWNIDDVSVLGFTAGAEDNYHFDLAAGQSVAVALTSLATDTAALELYDSGYHLVARGAPATNVGQGIDHFVSSGGGTYYLRITGNGAPYSLVVTKDASFDLEPNNSLTAAQDITGQTTVLGYVKQGIPGQQFGPSDPGLSSHDIYKLDDGTQENALGLNVGGDVLWLNCFDAIPGFEEISSVNLTWGPMSNGKASKVLVYEDPNNDGDPTDAVLLTMADVSVANAGTNTFISVPITPVTVEGKFFIGAMVQNQVGGESPAPVDTNSSAHSSWIVGNTTPGGMDIYDLGNNDVPPVLLDDLGLPGNFLLRADGQAPVDTDWYSISVQAGNQLTISTATPAGGPQEFVNSLDPYIELYDPAGTLVAWDDNSASDLKNAQITYTAAMTGNYTVRVLGAGVRPGSMS